MCFSADAWSPAVACDFPLRNSSFFVLGARPVFDQELYTRPVGTSWALQRTSSSKTCYAVVYSSLSDRVREHAKRAL